MTSERWQRVKELMHEALDLPAADRKPFLDHACGDDSELRTEIDSLLASYNDSGDFLDGPPIHMPETTASLGGVATSRAGERIGSYRIVREIGRGGMGAVYLAIRADESFRKQVAIKILRRTLDNAYIQRKFKTERQILASLNHPNIAQLLDGGSTAEGLPYFVMEYVDGEPIDQYCDQKKLSTTDRLKVFAKVCSAVQAAHESHIVHRDIKPGNILISSSGEPKLLDFGIAKIVDPDSTIDNPDPTVTQLRMLTPEYASPEQIRGESVTPATDIYSLGVLLYELLTGHKPYKVRSRTPHEIAHAICEEEPEKPSTAIKRVEHTTRSMGQPKTITPEYVSAVRSTQPSELRKKLCGDLDNIVLMAVRKEPFRRYHSAGALGEDVQRHLEGRPVKARGDTLSYRGSKLVRRHWVSLLAGALAAISGVLALILTFQGRGTENFAAFAQARTIPFTTFRGDEIQPSFSPDGKRVAFIYKGDLNNQPEVYVRDANASSEAIRLTYTAGEESSPSWSPDSRSLAFLRLDGPEPGLFIIPAAGGEERRVATTLATGIERAGPQVTWHPDNRSLIAVDRDNASTMSAIYRIDIETGRKQRLTTPNTGSVGDLGVAVSPNGKLLAFVRVAGSGVNDLFVQDLKGGEPQRITYDHRWINGLTFSANSKDLVFVSNRTGNPSIFHVAAKGGTPERFPGINQNVGDPAFSNDGKRLAYTLLTIDANVWQIDLTPPYKVAPVIVSSQYDSSASASPDGKRLAFRSNRGGTSEIWRCDSDGSNAVELTHFRGPLTGTPRWSRDGKWIAFDSRPNGRAQIYLVSPDGGEPRNLTDDEFENVVPSFSNDSRYVYYSSPHGGNVWQVWKKPVEGGQPIQVTKEGGFSAAESPDGKYLYFAHGRTEPGLRRMPMGGGTEETIYQDLKSGFWGMWAIARCGIYLFDVPTYGRGVAYLFHPDTRKRELLGETDKGKSLVLATSNLSISADEKRLFFTQQDQSSSDIVLADISK